MSGHRWSYARFEFSLIALLGVANLKADFGNQPTFAGEEVLFLPCREHRLRWNSSLFKDDWTRWPGQHKVKGRHTRAGVHLFVVGERELLSGLVQLFR